MAIIRDPIAATLSSAGYEALCASTGGEAIKLIQSEQPDLVLLDIHLPDMSGMQVLRLIRSAPVTAQIPVILLSADERRDCILEAAKLGVQGYLIKSQFSLKDMLSRISDQFGDRVVQQRGQTNAADPVSPASDGACTPTTEHTSAPATARKAQATSTTLSVSKDAGSTTGAPQVAELLRSLKPIITREQVLEQVDLCAELKALSPTVAQLLNMTGATDCSLDQIA